MILLDTSALIRWICVPEQLSQKARMMIRRAIQKEQILVSSISVWEIALLIKKGRVGFFINAESWLEQLENLPFIVFISVDNHIAQRSVNLDGDLPNDPADRMIAATALKYGATLVTSDKRLLGYPHIQTIW